MRGAKALASYTKQAITEYAGNPLIEALPPILDEAAAAELILRISEHRDRPFRLIVTAHFANA